jgi:hypothetical protein
VAADEIGHVDLATRAFSAAVCLKPQRLGCCGAQLAAAWGQAQTESDVLGNDSIYQQPTFDDMAFVILTGASGSGKTTIAEAVAARYGEQIDVHHFDSVGVPAPERMIAEWGSGEVWQSAMTHKWMARIGPTLPIGRQVLVEGQMRLSFVVEATAVAGITDYTLILVDCDDATRTKRLFSDRRQENLATPAMLNWAQYLRGEATQLSCTIFDTGRLSLNDCVQRVWSQFGQ